MRDPSNNPTSRIGEILDDVDILQGYCEELEHWLGFKLTGEEFARLPSRPQLIAVEKERLRRRLTGRTVEANRQYMRRARGEARADAGLAPRLTQQIPPERGGLSQDQIASVAQLLHEETKPKTRPITQEEIQHLSKSPPKSPDTVQEAIQREAEFDPTSFIPAKKDK